MAVEQVMEMMKSFLLMVLQLVNLIGSRKLKRRRSVPIPETETPAATVKKGKERGKFILIERVKGKPSNVVRGLQIYDGVFDSDEQNDIVKVVHKLKEKGKNKQFIASRTYSDTARWLRGKGGCTMQFGSNYAEDRKGNPPGKLTNEVVDPLPTEFGNMIQKLVDFNIISADHKPDNCVVKIYNKDGCLSPDTYHTDFLRPSCTISLVTNCNILFGVNTKKSDTELSAPIPIPLPPGSVLVLNGNSAKVAKQWVPHMEGERISITFRKMDETKLPLKKSPDSLNPLPPWQKTILRMMSIYLSYQRFLFLFCGYVSCMELCF